MIIIKGHLHLDPSGLYQWRIGALAVAPEGPIEPSPPPPGLLSPPTPSHTTPWSRRSGVGSPPAACSRCAWRPTRLGCSRPRCPAAAGGSGGDGGGCCWSSGQAAWRPCLGRSCMGRQRRELPVWRRTWSLEAERKEGWTCQRKQITEPSPQACLVSGVCLMTKQYV